MSMQPQEQPSLIERVERAMVLLAYFIELDGEVHVPMFEKFETELKDLKDAEDVKARARRLLLLHGLSGNMQALKPRDVIPQGNDGAGASHWVRSA